MHITRHTDPTLLTRVATGDQPAFRELFDQYWDNIYGVALAFTKSPELSEEIVQDIFVKVWQQRSQLTGVERFDHWLFIIARNHIYNTLRKKVREVPFTLELADYFETRSDSSDQRLLLRESEALVRRAVDNLPPQQRKIWLMSRQQGLSQEEIAAELQLSKHTIKSHMSKALATLRDWLRTHADETLFLACILHAYLQVK